jgi:parallel beta-helix repeat protein
VTIVNGTLRDFGGAGVYIDGGATGNRLDALVLTDDHPGVEVRNSTGNAILSSSIERNEAAGILVADSQGTQIVNNTLSNVRATTEVLLGRSTNSLVKRNIMYGAYILAVDSVLGSNNDIIGNIISATRTTSTGIYTDSADSRIAGNEISGFDEAAIYVNEDGIRVEKNLIHASRRGVWLQGSTFYGRPTGVVVRRNDVFDTDIGILVRELTDTIVQRNLTHDDRLGIVVRNSDGTVIVKNRSDRNDQDGIQVHDPATAITHNRADLNGDLGIEAVVGVVDGGGNRAEGNGNPAQCLNVDCSTGGG